VIAHIVLFEPKAGTTAGDRDGFLDALKAAVESIPSVNRSFVGLAVKVGARYETLIGGMTYSYASVIEFDDVAGLKSYLDHPLHERIGQLFWQHCDRTLITDIDCFWLNDKK
jgi:hypothetical protein